MKDNDATDAVDGQGILEQHVRQARSPIDCANGEPLGRAFQLH